MVDQENKTSLKYPILFVHGFGFRDRKKFSYWGRIPSIFEKKRCPVFFGNQDSSATIYDNALHLKSKIEEILRQTNTQKVNIIAHSKGGLDVRYLISSLKMEDEIASLTTICTPHHGSKTIQIVPKFILRIVGFFTDIAMRIFGDKHPSTYRSFLSFREDEAVRFNQANPDSANVYYQSYAFEMKHDIILWFPKLLIKVLEGENDGLVTTKSAVWGDFKGVVRSNSKRGISHCDEVDFRRRRFTKKTGEGVSDILEVYEQIYSTLEEKGF